MESAGTEARAVRPEAIAAMRELGIDISGHRSGNVDEFEGQRFDYVIGCLRQRPRNVSGVPRRGGKAASQF